MESCKQEVSLFCELAESLLKILEIRKLSQLPWSKEKCWSKFPNIDKSCWSKGKEGKIKEKKIEIRKRKKENKF